MMGENQSDAVVPHETRRTTMALVMMVVGVVIVTAAASGAAAEAGTTEAVVAAALRELPPNLRSTLRRVLTPRRSRRVMTGLSVEGAESWEVEGGVLTPASPRWIWVLLFRSPT